MRETGEVRKGLSGDTEAAAPYIGLARVLLGQLKQRMRLGNLMHLVQTKLLPDGTTITVMSSHGRDTIRIDAAVAVTAISPVVIGTPVIPESEIPAISIPTTSFGQFLVGGMGQFLRPAYPDARTGNSDGLLWPKGKPVQDLGLPPLGVVTHDPSTVTALSKDGQTVIGTAAVFNVDHSDTQGWRWTSAGGYETLDLGIYDPMNNDPYTAVYGASSDGGTLVGQANLLDNSIFQPFEWTKARGGTPLALGSYAQGVATGIAPDGAVIVGAGLDAFGNHSDAVMWDAQRNLIVLDKGGGYAAFATAASTGGKIVVGAVRQNFSDTEFTPCYWKNGVLTLLPATGVAYAVSADGGVIGGALACGNVLYFNDFSAITYITPSYNAISRGSTMTPHAFYWTTANGITDLGPGCVLGVSWDGKFVAGSAGYINQQFSPLPSTTATPAVWEVGSNTRTDLTWMAGLAVATCVTTA